MLSKRRERLQAMIGSMRRQLNQLEALVAKEPLPEKQWYTRREFAAKKGLKPQTVSNYLARRKYGPNQCKKDGQWHIHKSELNHQQPNQGTNE